MATNDKKNDDNKMKVVYTITERGDRSFWTRIGVAYVNRDGSISIKLDALPVNGCMQVRDWQPSDQLHGSAGVPGNDGF